MNLKELVKFAIDSPELDREFKARGNGLLLSKEFEYSNGGYIARLFADDYLIIFIYLKLDELGFEVKFHRAEKSKFINKKGKSSIRHKMFEQIVNISMVDICANTGKLKSLITSYEIKDARI
jgi:hypothetical protein